MNKEIKEILDDLKKCVNENKAHLLLEFEIKHLQCYITNLQEENERLKESMNCKKCCFIKDNVNYIQRIDKAIEYHNNCIENLELSKINDNEKLAYQVAYEIHKNYLNILQGEDKDE